VLSLPRDRPRPWQSGPSPTALWLVADNTAEPTESAVVRELVDLTHPSSNTLGDSNTLWSWLKEVAELRQAA
jgi:hypothetical protein